MLDFHVRMLWPRNILFINAMKFRYYFLFSMWNVSPSSLEAILCPARRQFYLLSKSCSCTNLSMLHLSSFKDKHGTCWLLFCRLRHPGSSLMFWEPTWSHFVPTCAIIPSPMYSRIMTGLAFYTLVSALYTMMPLWHFTFTNIIKWTK
jgi:hypothetical protein